jgi:hypothetical protein
MNLPEAAQSFMKHVETSIDDPKQQETMEKSESVSSSQLQNSIRSADDDAFFLPFDEDLEVTPEEPNALSPPNTMTTTTTKEAPPSRNSSTLQKVVKSQEQQQHRNDAMARLEEFFLGETSLSGSPESSPVSVLNFQSGKANTATTASSREAQRTPASQPSSPKRNMFGQIMDPELVETTATKMPPQPEETKQTADGTEENETAAPQFHKLCKSDRAHSMPIECMTNSQSQSSLRGLTKKPSLKKISSIGKFPRQRSDDSLKPTVSFSNLQIREYNVAISDHPSCSYGPPVQLSWDYQKEKDIPLDSYEESREPRREVQELVLSYYDRRFLLLIQAGYSKKEVKEAMKEVERVKRERLVTDMFLPASPLDETMEHVIDTVKKYFQAQAAEV